MRNTTVDKTQVIFAKGRDLLERSAPRMGLALLLQINPEQLRPPQQKEWLGLLWANRDQGTERGDLCWKVAACLAKNRERLDVGAQREFGDWLEQAAQALFREGQPSGATLRLVKQAIADCGMRTDALCRAYGEACVRLAAEAIAPVAGPSSLEHTQLSTEVCLTQLRDAVRVAEHDLELTASIGAVAMQGWAQLGSRVPALRDTVSPEVLYSFLQSIRDAALRIDWWTPEQRIAAVTEPYNQLVGQLQTEDVADALDALKLS